MFDRFTDRALKAMALARKEAQRFNHDFIGTEHILLGLVGEGSGVAANVLKDLRVDLRKIRAEVEKNVQAGTAMITMGQLPFTPRAKKVLELAKAEASELGFIYIGTEVLLLGLLAEREGIAAQVLLGLGLNLEEVRSRVLSLLHMAERFTGQLDRVLDFAFDEAKGQRQGEGLVDIAHIFLGLLAKGGRVTQDLLRISGINISIQKARGQLEKKLAEKPPSPEAGQLEWRRRRPGFLGIFGKMDTRRFSRDAERLLTKSGEEAERLKHRFIGVEHVLLALLGDEESPPAKILREAGGSLESLRSTLPELMIERRLAHPEQRGFGRFTDRSKKAMALAWKEAQRFNQDFLGPEHILIGLIQEGSGVAANVLRILGVEINKIRAEIEEEARPGSSSQITGQVPFTQAAKDALEKAEGAADHLGHGYIGTEHLLLGLLRVESKAISSVLTALGLTPEDVRKEVLQLTAPELKQNKSGNMFERFSDRARKVMALARREAQRLNHDFIGTEHILLGMIQEEDAKGTRILKDIGVDLEKLRAEIEQNVQKGPTMVTMGQLPFTPRAKKVLELALKQANDLDHHRIGTEHLLIGLIEESEGVAAKVLLGLKLNLDDVRKRTISMVGQERPPDSPRQWETDPMEDLAAAGSLIPTRGIELVDGNRKVRARLAVAEDGSPALELLDQNGIARLSLALGPDGTPVIEFRDPGGKVVSTFSPPQPPPWGA
jgi:ATP-dependent Clp protease ATP-binding subunit ClpA